MRSPLPFSVLSYKLSDLKHGTCILWNCSHCVAGSHALVMAARSGDATSQVVRTCSDCWGKFKCFSFISSYKAKAHSQCLSQLQGRRLTVKEDNCSPPKYFSSYQTGITPLAFQGCWCIDRGFGVKYEAISQSHKRDPQVALAHFLSDDSILYP